MTDIQLALLSVGLATPQKINKINRQKAIDESFIRTAQKAVPLAGSQPLSVPTRPRPQRRHQDSSWRSEEVRRLGTGARY